MIDKSSLPFYEEFWLDKNNDGPVGKYKNRGDDLDSVRGYIVSMPVFWGYKENNNLNYSLDVITRNGVNINPSDVRFDEKSVSLASNDYKNDNGEML